MSQQRGNHQSSAILCEILLWDKEVPGHWQDVVLQGTLAMVFGVGEGKCKVKVKTFCIFVLPFVLLCVRASALSPSPAPSAQVLQTCQPDSTNPAPVQSKNLCGQHSRGEHWCLLVDSSSGLEETLLSHLGTNG